MNASRPRTWAAAASLVVLLLCSPAAEAQLPTTVQLPSFSSFSYSGTVVVPDGGAAYAGGVRRSASGRTRRGWFNRGFGSQQSNSGLSVHATIIDHDEIDRQLLGGTKQEFMARHQPARKDEAKPPPTPSDEGKALVRHARKLYLAGKKTAAFDTYQMAIEILPPELSVRAAAEFERLYGPAAAQAVRMASVRR